MPLPVTISISGLSFDLTPPFEPGHKCSPSEAQVLNQAWVDNIKTNFSKRVGDGAGLDDEAIANLRQEFASYVAVYEFKSSGPRSIGDPVLREASKIAKAKVMEHLNLKGIARASLSDEKFDSMIANVANHPAVYGEAKRRIEALSVVAGEVFDLDLAIGASA